MSPVADINPIRGYERERVVCRHRVPIRHSLTLVATMWGGGFHVPAP